MSRRTGIASWCLFDWALSAFSTIVTTFIFAAYFTSAVAADPIVGTELWGLAASLAALIVALSAPVLGAIADQGGPRKPWLIGFTLAAAGFTALLYSIHPTPTDILRALTTFVAATIAAELAMVFYNAMLPSIAPQRYIGRISGWAWGLGYAGGLVCLVVALTLFVEPSDRWFTFNRAEAQNIRATTLLAALWMVVFAVPLFAFTPDRSRSGLSTVQALRAGFSALINTAKIIRGNPNIVRFLIAFLFYANGLVTLFAFGGIYAVGTFGLSMAEMTRFAIALNVSAGAGAMAFSWLDDWIGPKKTIAFALTGLLVCGTVLVITTNLTVFWTVGFALGLFVGPAQAAGRSLMARLAPEPQQTAMFGFYALAGKSTAFAGPLILSQVTAAFGSQRIGVASILVFLLLGFVFLLTVKEPAPCKT